MASIWLCSEPEDDWMRLSSSCFWAILDAGSPKALWPTVTPATTSAMKAISESTAMRPRRVVLGLWVRVGIGSSAPRALQARRLRPG